MELESRNISAETQELTYNSEGLPLRDRINLFIIDQIRTNPLDVFVGAEMLGVDDIDAFNRQKYEARLAELNEKYGFKIEELDGLKREGARIRLSGNIADARIDVNALNLYLIYRYPKKYGFTLDDLSSNEAELNSLIRSKTVLLVKQGMQRLEEHPQYYAYLAPAEIGEALEYGLMDDEERAKVIEEVERIQKIERHRAVAESIQSARKQEHPWDMVSLTIRSYGGRIDLNDLDLKEEEVRLINLESNPERPVMTKKRNKRLK